MKILWTIITTSFLFSQGNYQILNSPSTFKQIFKEDEVNTNYSYNFFHTSFPAQINFSSVTASLNNIFPNANYKIFIDFESLDYGKLTDNISNYTFNANEILLRIKVNNRINDKVQGLFSIGLLKSKLDQYNSSALVLDYIFSHQFFNNIINIKFENFGKVITKYTSSNIDLPSIIGVSYTKNLKPLSLIINYENQLDLKESTYYLSLKFNVNKKLKLYLGANSNKKDLMYGEYIEKLMAGTSLGLSYNTTKNIFYLALQNMGPAGYATSISFLKINL